MKNISFAVNGMNKQNKSHIENDPHNATVANKIGMQE